MKTLKQLLVMLSLLLAFSACEKTIEAEQAILEIENNQDLTLTTAEEQALSQLGGGFYGRHRIKKFKAKFVTEQDLTDPRLGFGSGDCLDTAYPFFNVQKGEGRARHLGDFTTEITFCVKPPAPGDAEIDYKDGKGTFLLPDGHELYIEIPVGVVKLIPPPAQYQAKFQDRFIITGGTGPYENARGIGITNSFVNFLPEGGDRTQHTWYGLILLDHE